MLYSDVYTADQTLGLIYIKAPCLSKPQDGQENSANGTGPEKTCAGQRGAN
jgi:hypothetical protein